MIAIGDTVPDIQLSTPGKDGPETVSTASLFAGRKVALFGVPGAFTPTCSAAHLPGFRDRRTEFDNAGVDLVCCTSVNDVFVMKAWAQQQESGEAITMLADGNAEFARATGLFFDGSGFGMGPRSKRYAMLIEDCVVTLLNVEQDGAFEVSSAEAVLAALDPSAPQG